MGASDRPLRTGEASYGEIGGHLTGEEGSTMIGVAEVHFKMEPGSFLQDAHVPRSGDGIGELPDDVKAFLVGESFEVGLHDGVATLPDVRAQGVERVAAFFGVVPLQMLEGVDGFDVGEIFVEPSYSALGQAVLGLVDEFADLILAHRAIVDRVALEDSDFNAVDAGEEDGVPFFFGAFFNGQLELRVRTAYELIEFAEGRELLVF